MCKLCFKYDQFSSGRMRSLGNLTLSLTAPFGRDTLRAKDASALIKVRADQPSAMRVVQFCYANSRPHGTQCTEPYYSTLLGSEIVLNHAI